MDNEDKHIQNLLQDTSFVESQLDRSQLANTLMQTELFSEKSDEGIDFRNLRQEFEQMTEQTVPFTNHIIEDVIFLGQTRAISLESIYYKSDTDYSKLKPVKSLNFTRIHEEPYMTFNPKPKEFLPSRDIYMGLKCKWHDESQQERRTTVKKSKTRNLKGEDGAKKTEPLKLMEIKKDKPLYSGLIQEQMSDQEDETKYFVESILCLWQINLQGQMKKINQVSFDYNQHYQATMNKNMRLTLSHCSSYFTLNLIEGKSITLMAWSTMQLKPLHISKAAQEQLTVENELKDIFLINNAEHILLIDKKPESQKYKIVCRTTGSVDFLFENKMPGEDYNCSEDQAPLCLGVVFHKTFKQRVTAPVTDEQEEQNSGNDIQNDDQEDEEEETEEDEEEVDEDAHHSDEPIEDEEASSLSSHTDDENNLLTRVISEMKTSVIPQGGFRVNLSEVQERQSEIEFEDLLNLRNQPLSEQFEGGQEDGIQEMEKKPLDITISAFFFKPNQVQHRNTSKKKKTDEIIKVTKVSVDLADTDLGEDIGAILASKANEQYDDVIQNHPHLAINLPKNWFVKNNGELTKYLTCTSVSCNKKANIFGFLNKLKKSYVAVSICKQFNTVREIGTHKFSVSGNQAAHARNSYTKATLQLNLNNWESQTTYVFLDTNTASRNKDDNDEEKLEKLEMDDQISQGMKLVSYIQSKSYNAWVDSFYNLKRNMFSSISITKDREVQLKVLQKQVDDSPTNNLHNQKLNIHRDTSSQRVQTSFPIIAYNVGQKKIIFQILVNQNRAIVYELPTDERFIDFPKFLSLKDLNFNTKTEIFNTSSSFVFLTEKRSKGQQKLIVNLMLIDPYFKTEQFMLFQTTKNFEQKKSGNQISKDEVRNSIIYSTRSTDGQDDNDIRLLLQYHDNIEFLEMSQTNADEEDSYNSGSDVSGNSQGDMDDELNEDEKLNMKYAPVNAIMNNYGDIYYLTSYEGQFTIWEINSSQTENYPQKIYETRTNKCLGFCFMNDYFYFIDDTKTVNKLKQDFETRQLINIEDFYFKEEDKPNFEYSKFSNCIIHEQIVIYKSGIYYLYKEKPLANGILDMEDLLVTDYDQSQDQKQETQINQLVHEAMIIKDSNQFVVIYSNGERYDCVLKVFQQPNSRKIKLIQNNNKAIDMATFLNDGSILVKSGYRFFRFSDNGKFISFIQFEKDSTDWNQQVKKLVGGVAQRIKNSKTLLEDRISVLNRLKSLNHESKKSKQKFKQHIDIQSAALDGTSWFTKVSASKQRHMKLLSISDNGKYYLFEDKLNRSISIYLINQQYTTFERSHDIPWKQSKVLTNDVGLRERGFISQHYSKITDFESLQEIIKCDQLRVSIDNQGDVIMVQCVDSGTETDDDIENQVTLLTIFGCRFSKEMPDKPIEFKQTVKFIGQPIEEAQKVIQEHEQLWKKLLKTEQELQQRLPYIMKCDKRTKKLYELLKQTQTRKNLLFSAKLFGKYLVVQCGRQLKKVDLTDYEDKPEMLYQDQQDCGQTESKLPFENVDITLSQTFEIVKILPIEFEQSLSMSQTINSTQFEDIIQIVAKDNTEGILIIVSWDLKNNCEYSMFQSRCDQEQSPENFVVRGLCNKLNYFVDEHSIYDLEFQIPMQSIPVNPLSGSGVGYKFQNQRKIYWNSSRHLSIFEPCCMSLHMTRQDLTFWDNIMSRKISATQIWENTTFSQYSQCFGNISLFHHFAKNYELIKYLHQYFVLIRDDVDVTKEDLNTPLMILNPDVKGLTALDVTLNNDRNLTFELMLDMLEDYKSICISKMMISVFPHMLNTQSDIVYKFFHTSTFEPYSMQSNIRIPWPDHLDEINFTSSTILISELKVIEEIEKELKGSSFGQLHFNLFISKTTSYFDSIKQQGSIQKVGSSDDNYENLSKLKDSNIDNQSQLQSMRSNAIKLNKTVREKILDDQDFQEKQQQAIVKRIEMECLDFDWIFQTYTDKCGYEKCNALALLRLLGDVEENQKLYKQNSIRIFLTMLWSKFYPLIIKWKFLPYLIYLGAQNVLTLMGASKVQIVVDQGEKAFTPDFLMTLTTFYVLSGVIQVLWLLNLRNEILEWMRDGLDYLKDPWNYLDLSITIMTQVYQFEFLTDIFTQTEVYKVSKIRTNGGIVLFLLWIKMFYWLRLFGTTASFIKLIIDTIYDLRQFFILIVVIMASFISLFYVFQQNVNGMTIDGTPDGEEIRYITSHTGIDIFDSILTIYLITVGEFNTDSYKYGPNNLVIWPMFIMCNFLLTVVFINMLIAIMGQTFNEVQASKIESDLDQKIELMKDYENLFDMTENFKNQKYIIHAKPVVIDSVHGEVDIQEALEETTLYLTKTFNKKLDEVQNQTMSLMKNQNSKIYQIQKTLNNYINQMQNEQTQTKQN